MEETSVVGQEEVRTLFVTGLPSDIKERELNILFRPYAGYECSTLRILGKQQMVAFVAFVDQSHAISARDSLQGFHFDPSSPHTILHIELAKSNSKMTKRTYPSSGGYAQHSGEKRMKTASNSDVYGAYGDPTTAALGYYNNYGDVSNLWNTSLMGGTYIDPNSFMSAALPPQARGKNPPCTTLYIGNIPLSATEDELRDLLLRFAGFIKVKITPKEGASSLNAFAEFQDISFSSAALASLQGYQMTMKPEAEIRGGFRVEYARNKMIKMTDQKIHQIK